MPERKFIDTDIWEPDAEKPNLLHYKGKRLVKDVYEELKTHLESEGLFPDEYFLGPHSYEELGKVGATFPEYRWIACYPVKGDSEGHYIHIDVIKYDEIVGATINTRLFLGKTFKGFEFAAKVANECARVLGHY